MTFSHNIEFNKREEKKIINYTQTMREHCKIYQQQKQLIIIKLEYY